MSKFSITKKIVIDPLLRIKIYQRTDSPNWWIQYPDPNKKKSQKKKQPRYSLKTPDEEEAIALARDVRRKIEDGKLKSVRATRASIDEVISKHAKKTKLRNRTEGTLRCYDLYGRKLLAYAETSGIEYFDELEPEFLDDFEEALLLGEVKAKPKPGSRETKRESTKHAPKTVRDTLKYVRILTRFALNRKMIAEDPAAGYDLPDGQSPEVGIFTAEILAHLLAHPVHDIADIFRFLLHTCLRIGELRWLLKSDVEFDDNGVPCAVYIRAKVCPTTGKSWKPKHGLERKVPLSRGAIVIVTRALANDPDVPWLFVSPVSRGPAKGRWSYQSLWRRLGDHLEEGGFSRCGFHRFRHTAASHLANGGGMPLPQLQKLLGHKSLATTEIYIHVDVTDIAATLSGLRLTTLTDPSQSEQAYDGDSQSNPAA